MAFLTQRFIQSTFKSSAAIRAQQEFTRPDMVTLPVRDGVSPNGKPTVRIFLGTEAAQFKAERIFIWSIEQVRDPARVYEIYLMKQLLDFKPRFWLTGFTNYRFAIPYFCEGKGRAIFNDVDQIYLRDPAEIFDLPMGEHGYLAIHPGDISVALLDCEKMLPLWSLDDARTKGKNELLARASEMPGLWGQLDSGWNARDREYVAGESGLIHYTALHRQPWHPLPGVFVYQGNSVADVWYKLEAAADKAAFRVFSQAAASQSFTRLQQLLAELPARPLTNAVDANPELMVRLDEAGCQSLQECSITALNTAKSLAPTDKFKHLPSRDCLSDQDADLPVADALICSHILEYLHDDDIPWMLESLFSRAGKLLDCRIDQRGNSPQLSSSIRLRQRDVAWWQYQFDLVARHHPGVRWCLQLQQSGKFGRDQSHLLEGNECLQRSPKVWVLSGHKPGHSSQAIALAEMLGWDYQLKQLKKPGLGAIFGILSGFNHSALGELKAPWPDVLIACGWWPCKLARWVQKRNAGKTRLLLAGRKNGGIKNRTDIAVNCAHFHLPVHRRRLQTLLPLHPITEGRLQAAAVKGRQLLEKADKPCIALLVGGDSKQYQLCAEAAEKMAGEVLAQSQAGGGSLFVVTSRRTSAAAASAIKKKLAGQAYVHIWIPEDKENPYMEFLAKADVLVVTGESESMLTDAIATGKPVCIYPLAKKRLNPWMALGSWLLARSSRQPKNRRGTERPQQGLEYFCSRILQTEWILPPRDMPQLQQRLVEAGYAYHFADGLMPMDEMNTYTQPEFGCQLRLLLQQPAHACNSEKPTGNGVNLEQEAMVS